MTENLQVWQRDLKLRLAVVAQPRGPLPWATHEHAHVFHEIGHVLTGEATWHIGPRRIRVRAGEVIWVPAGALHYESFVTAQPTRIAWVGFDLTPGPIPGPRRRVAPPVARAELLRLFEAIERESSSSALGARERSLLALRELLILYARGCQPNPPVREYPAPSRRARIAGAVAHSLTENLASPLSIAELAHYHGITPSHLARVFQRERGITPQAFLINARLEHARHLMRTTTEPLKAIAATCGFTDDAHFSHCFKQHIGSTPARWRRATT